jgi:hypothetical protein
MEGEDKESRAPADNHQVVLPERAHSPATDRLVCSSNQTETVKSTAYADMALSTAAVPVEVQLSAFSSGIRIVQISWRLLQELLCAGR